MLDIKAGLDALEAVKKVFPGAILAGGYLRDKFFGRTPKDIDIFVPFDAELIALSAHAISGAQSVKLVNGVVYMSQNEVTNVWDVTGFELPVQIIECAPGRNPVDRIKLHDFDFCQVWHDGMQLHWTSAFEDASRFRQVTLVHCEDEKQFDRSMRRWDRLKQKYPDFGLVVPSRFNHLGEAPSNAPADGMVFA